MRISDWSSDVCSSDLDDYVHRIGRTGRAGAQGRAFTLVTPSDDEAIDNIQKLTGYKIPIHGGGAAVADAAPAAPGEEHTSELQSLMRISYAVFCLKKKKQI